MHTRRFQRRSPIPAPPDAVYAWHTRPGAFARLTPPWEGVTLEPGFAGLRDGAVAVLRIGASGMKWVARHSDIQPGRQFVDEQTEGPFAHWRHTHRFTPGGDGGTQLEDDIAYALPGGMLTTTLLGPLVDRKLARMFAFRHRQTRDDLSQLQSLSRMPPMKIAVTGSTGLVGSALVPLLSTAGHEVLRLVRSRDEVDEGAAYWRPSERVIDRDALEGVDVVVHLAGVNIAAGRWTKKLKKLIRDSRVDSTTLLCDTLVNLDRRPKALICASAIGYYGSRGDEVLDEDSAAGEGFLADVCIEWEHATRIASQKGIRVVNARLGAVLSPAGGALAKMLLPFKLGLGGRIGDGRQYMPWISIDDVAGAFLHAIATESLEGPVNFVAPEEVTNRQFTRTLGRVLRRPTMFPVPALAARLAFGEMAEHLLLASTRVKPRRLEASAYAFRHPTLETALRHVLGKGAT